MLHNSPITGLTPGCWRLKFLFMSLVPDLNQSVSVTSQLRPLTPPPVCGDSPNTTGGGGAFALVYTITVHEGGTW